MYLGKILWWSLLAQFLLQNEVDFSEQKLCKDPSDKVSWEELLVVTKYTKDNSDQWRIMGIFLIQIAQCPQKNAALEHPRYVSEQLCLIINAWCSHNHQFHWSDILFWTIDPSIQMYWLNEAFYWAQNQYILRNLHNKFLKHHILYLWVEAVKHICQRHHLIHAHIFLVYFLLSLKQTQSEEQGCNQKLRRNGF